MTDNTKKVVNKYSPSEFKIEMTTMDRPKEIGEFVLKHFFAREQLCVGFHVPLKEGIEFFGPQIEKHLTSGVSVAAVHCPTNRLAAVSLNSVLTRDSKYTFNTEDVKDKSNELQKMIEVLSEMEREADLFADPKIEKILEIAMTAADPEFSGNKITYRMTEEIEKLAKGLGCQMATAQTTNKITQHIRTKMGYEAVLRVDYKDLEREKDFDLSVLNGTEFAVVFKKYL